MISPVWGGAGMGVPVSAAGGWWGRARGAGGAGGRSGGGCWLVETVVVPVVVAAVVPVVEAVVRVRSVVRDEDRVMPLGATELRAEVFATRGDATSADAKLRAAETVGCAAGVPLLVLSMNDVLRTKPVNARVELPDGGPASIWLDAEDDGVDAGVGECLLVQDALCRGKQTELWQRARHARVGWGRRPGQRCRRRGSHTGRLGRSRCRCCRGRRTAA